ncbi:5-carboxymethyl-2-hydroxymuconate isomerase [Paenibacillus sp. FSL H8-0548]|uniref:fumarylacetoacetate hydrolase family protein n=1 Tax=Paenibacillus sp. FSL H8-0548 TaxID=1920422 RepID=UPI00096D1897|nr:fumarylacetoacetate hydrolase family protein [Paenibacillus sp. FSL H8-0548]OMF34646.1 5-carboxymethyl-2-hydroxymuconate isomerase [Paenibacillus sp. FSL H8-0548]
MKLVNLLNDNTSNLGVQTDHGIIDLKLALTMHPSDHHVNSEMMPLIRGGQEALGNLESYIATLPTNAESAFLLQVNSVTWAPCVPDPQKLICVGLNYRKHAEETNSPIPKYPILFNKFNNSLTGHHAEVVIPNVTKKLDYEAELAIIIGKKAKNVKVEEALSCVFGYTIANDLSARDLQTLTPQWMLGKSCDGFAPLGPSLVTADEVENPNQLDIQTLVNGELRQNSNTKDMIFHCDEIISFISRHMTLEPGDVILTGTPEGVVFGLPEHEQVYLQAGDEVTVRINKLGSLTNRFVAEG